jgi:hypothetical protein
LNNLGIQPHHKPALDGDQPFHQHRLMMFPRNSLTLAISLSPKSGFGKRLTET